MFLDLKFLLKSRIFGQHIATDVVLNAINSHLKKPNPRKPLVMSFHGANGVGKSYVSKMIAKVLYEKGDTSKFFHFYYGLENFPLIEKISEYQVSFIHNMSQQTHEKIINKCFIN